MKELFHRIGAICMAIVVLFSTLSFTVDMHYCGQTLVDLSIVEADNCLMASIMPADTSGCASMQKMHCCTDVEINFEGQDELKVSFDQLSFDQKLFLTTYLYTYTDLFNEVEETAIPFDGYPPPLLVRDIQVLYESFLI
ncbi:MAG: hypothetical protein HKP60_04095 [Eudoraea sp.]|nr:hypothetical protein [Eudoraea sp.]NNJ40034.1 hypothetical protein [Eudoraea sp.]